jgi:hypothetical protein
MKMINSGQKGIKNNKKEKGIKSGKLKGFSDLPTSGCPEGDDSVVTAMPTPKKKGRKDFSAVAGQCPLYDGLSSNR